MSNPPAVVALTADLPVEVCNELRTALAPGENVLAVLSVDLDDGLRFNTGTLALTEHRLLAHEPGAASWQAWPLSPELSLRHADHAGVGSIELCDTGSRLARWRFTLGANAQALKLLKAFERQQARRAGLAVEDDESADDDSLAARELQTSPSTWVLLRLGRFARPYRKQLLLGFGLTLASTAATLVPPYLTIPLMDKVLIPFQGGQRIDPQYVLLLLSGLLGSALLAWSLGWARTWLLALVSERIAADLRTAAFEHLLHLSLDYFGAKRTGDLMARIGSETDRISVFLSLHALDFATDVLMICLLYTSDAADDM
jgi:ATP-binding cassette subfamily B protein